MWPLTYVLIAVAMLAGLIGFGNLVTSPVGIVARLVFTASMMLFIFVLMAQFKAQKDRELLR